jgi:hypothetical protein
LFRKDYIGSTRPDVVIALLRVGKLWFSWTEIVYVPLVLSLVHGASFLLRLVDGSLEEVFVYFGTWE